MVALDRELGQALSLPTQYCFQHSYGDRFTTVSENIGNEHLFMSHIMALLQQKLASSKRVLIKTITSMQPMDANTLSDSCGQTRMQAEKELHQDQPH